MLVPVDFSKTGMEQTHVPRNQNRRKKPPAATYQGATTHWHQTKQETSFNPPWVPRHLPGACPRRLRIRQGVTGAPLRTNRNASSPKLRGRHQTMMLVSARATGAIRPIFHSEKVNRVWGPKGERDQLIAFPPSDATIVQRSNATWSPLILSSAYR